MDCLMTHFAKVSFHCKLNLQRAELVANHHVRIFAILFTRSTRYEETQLVDFEKIKYTELLKSLMTYFFAHFFFAFLGLSVVCFGVSAFLLCSKLFFTTVFHRK